MKHHHHHHNPGPHHGRVHETPDNEHEHDEHHHHNDAGQILVCDTPAQFARGCFAHIFTNRTDDIFDWGPADHDHDNERGEAIRVKRCPCLSAGTTEEVAIDRPGCRYL